MDDGDFEKRLHRLEATVDEILEIVEGVSWGRHEYSGLPDIMTQQFDSLDSKLHHIREKLIVSQHPLTPEQEAEIKNLVQSDQRVAAIKRYHAIVPVRLKWAVSAIEDMYKDLQISRAETEGPW